MKTLFTGFLVLVLSSVVCLGTTETLHNDSGGTATGVTITFSEKVRITSYDTAIFPNQDPTGRADDFTFSGAALANRGDFKLSWSPSSASIMSAVWQVVKLASVKNGIAQILGDHSLDDLPLIQAWDDSSPLTYGQVPLKTSQWQPSDSRYARLEDEDCRIACLKGGILPAGLVLRIEFATGAHPSATPEVEYQVGFQNLPACVLLSPGSEVSGRVYSQTRDTELPWSMYMVDANSMTIAIPDTELVAQGMSLKAMVGVTAWLSVKYRDEDVHYFLNFAEGGKLWRVLNQAEILAEAAAVAEAARIPGLEYLGNPFAGRLPDGSGWEASRRVWDMQSFGERIYMAHGNSQGNSGPTPIWYWDCATEQFVQELTVDDEAIREFRVVEGGLLVAGSDATESWDFGNLYFFDGTTWAKRRTLPGALHVYSACRFQNDVFAVITTTELMEVLRSTDDGLTWAVVFSTIETYIPSLVEFGGTLYLSEPIGNAGFRWDGSTFSQVEGLQLFTEVPPSVVNETLGFRVGPFEPFVGRVVYIGTFGQWRSSLYAIREPTATGVERIAAVGSSHTIVSGDQWSTHQVLGEAPQDMVVEGGACWVLTNELHSDDIAATVRVYRSDDLIQWTQVLEFEAPTIAQSFEVRGTYLYFGLGPAHPYTYYETSIGENHSACGRVYRYALP